MKIKNNTIYCFLGLLFIVTNTYANSTISVISAFYGSDYIYNSSPADVKQTDTIQQCNGLEECSFEVNNELTGGRDPKKGFNKEVKIHYNCVEQGIEEEIITEKKLVIGQEGGTVTLTCRNVISPAYCPNPNAFADGINGIRNLVRGAVRLIGAYQEVTEYERDNEEIGIRGRAHQVNILVQAFNNGPEANNGNAE